LTVIFFSLTHRSVLCVVCEVMPSTPGRPVEPTLHPRTRPEANDYALKNRQTSDWFRHDAVTMAAAAARGRPPCSPTGEWLTHNPSDAAPEKPHPGRRRCTTNESKAIHDRVYGRQEAWFKHDDNRDYVDPTPADRGSVSGVQVNY
jgi:hypothetical protein